MLIGNVKEWASWQKEVQRNGLHSLSMFKCLTQDKDICV
jgi:hypothetical protein